MSRDGAASFMASTATNLERGGNRELLGLGQLFAHAAHRSVKFLLRHGVVRGRAIACLGFALVRAAGASKEPCDQRVITGRNKVGRRRSIAVGLVE